MMSPPALGSAPARDAGRAKRPERASRPSRHTLGWATLAVLFGAPTGCLDWPDLDGGECAETDVEIAQGDTYGDFDPWELAGQLEGTWQGTVQWVYVASEPGIAITLETGYGSAVAHYLCTDLVSFVVPMILWIRTDDGVLDVVFASDLQLSPGGVPVDDEFSMEMRLFAISPSVLPPGSRSITTAADRSVRIDLDLDKTGTALGYEDGELTVLGRYSSETLFGQIRPAS